jgi:diguanylate cyclase (GGDEF)-like protein/PAS domain S-box-containing protein
VNAPATNVLPDQYALLIAQLTHKGDDGLVVADAQLPDFPVIYVNEGFERITGYTREEVLGRNVRFLQGEETEQPELDVIRQALRDSSGCKVTLRNFRKDGTPFWNLLTIVAAHNDEGRLTHFIGLLMDVTEQRRAEAEMAYALGYDTVTGLPRLEVVHDHIQNQIAASPWDPLCVLFIDIDRFFDLSQLLGHEAGNALLREAGKRVREAAGAEARVACVSSDKLVVSLRRCVPQKAAAIAERIRIRLNDFFIHADVRMAVSASIGVAGYPAHGMKAMDLVRYAKKAMSRAKRLGGNAVCLSTDDRTPAEFEQRRLLAAAVSNASRNNELELRYEPRVGGRDSRVTGFEALTRWNRPGSGWVSPAKFIPVIETLGLMPELGGWIIREACRQMRVWRDAGHRDLMLSINVSPQQLLETDFARSVREALAASDLPGSVLELEFSKGIFNLNFESVRAMLIPLKALGVTFALDDFGADQSSFEQLEWFAALKIDRSHVVGLPHNERSVAIAKSILAIGRNMGMAVVAEGIETAVQHELLLSLGCTQFQGYLFAQAMVGTDVLPWLDARRS